MDTIVVSINGEEKGIFNHQTLASLARDIANIPQNHDELEIVIADKIKRFIHQEKSSVYQRILEYASFEEEEERSMHLNSLINGFLKPKIETHTELADKWEYGTEYSCREAIMRPPFAQELLDILNGKHNGALYYAASLCNGKYTYHPNSVTRTEGIFSENAKKWEYNSYEKYLWCRLYLKYKTKHHSYYKEAQDFVALCEGDNGPIKVVRDGDD